MKKYVQPVDTLGILVVVKIIGSEIYDWGIYHPVNVLEVVKLPQPVYETTNQIDLEVGHQSLILSKFLLFYLFTFPLCILLQLNQPWVLTRSWRN